MFRLLNQWIFIFYAFLDQNQIFHCFCAMFMLSEPPVNPKAIQNRRGLSRNDSRFFDMLEGFGPQILTSVLVKPGLIVKRFDAKLHVRSPPYHANATSSMKKRHIFQLDPPEKH